MRSLVIAVVAAVVVASTGEVSAQEELPETVGIQLVSHPDQADLGQRGLTSIVAEAQAGAVVERQVIASNDTGQVQTLDVYVGGATVDEGGFRPDDEFGPIPGWATTSPSTVVLEPGERERVDVTIAVPTDAMNGEHVGAVWVQPPASGGDIRQVNRVGVRIYLTVSGGTGQAVAPADFTIDSLTAVRLADGRPRVLADVSNTGGRVLDLVGELGLSEGPSSLSAGPFPTDRGVTLAQGDSAQVSVTLPSDLPLGPWLARLELESGDVVRAAEARLSFPVGTDISGDPIPTETTNVERQRAILIPIASSLLLTVLVMLLVLWWGWRRRDGADDPPEGVA